MENDDEFVSFPHISRFSERAKLALVEDILRSCTYTWYSFPHNYTRLSLPALFHWANAHVCMLAKRIGIVYLDGRIFIPPRATAPRRSSSIKSEEK